MLTYKEILELIDKVALSGIASVEVEQAGVRIRIEGKPSTPALASISSEGYSLAGASVTSTGMSSQDTAPGSSSSAAEASVDASTHIITSPIVGTFYRSSNPESDPFIGVGDRIEKGSVLCIVEAMKLMNEIESDVEGVVVEIYPQNGQPIEYGEKLFAVRL